MENHRARTFVLDDSDRLTAPGANKAGSRFYWLKVDAVGTRRRVAGDAWTSAVLVGPWLIGVPLADSSLIALPQVGRVKICASGTPQN